MTYKPRYETVIDKIMQEVINKTITSTEANKLILKVRDIKKSLPN